jgi:hypothetical protein
MTVKELIIYLQDLVDWEPAAGEYLVVKRADDTCKGFYFDIDNPYISCLTKNRESYHDYYAIPKTKEPMIQGVII